MRSLEAVDADLKTLGRPLHPGVASILDPKLIATWRAELAAWQARNPDGAQRYELLLEEREAIEDATLKARQQSVRVRELAGKAGLPRLVRDALSNPKPLPVLGLVDAWLKSGKAWLVLAGGVGVGKSVAAGYGLTRAAESGASVAWSTSAGFATAVGGFSGQAECERLKHVDVLALDDLGTEHMTPFAASVLFEVLHHRHEDGRRTILTTNLGKPELRARLGERLADRVASACHYVEVTGESLRGGAR